MAPPRRSTSKSRTTARRPAKKPAPRRRSGILRFEMPSARAAVAPAVERILEHVENAGLSENQRADLAIALSEALANAAIHGNQLRAECAVSVAVRVQPESEAVIEIQDCGLGFDHTHLSDPTSDTQVLMPGGRGVFLMKHLVDRLEYNEAGNCVRLIVRPE